MRVCCGTLRKETCVLEFSKQLLSVAIADVVSRL